MTKRKFTRPVLGDIVEVPLKRGFAYVQYVYRHRDPPVQMGDLIRVLPGIFAKRPKEFSELNAKHERFIAFFPVAIAVRRKYVSIVAHEKVPERFKTLPLFKAAGLRSPETSKPLSWGLWDGKKSWRVSELTEEERRLPLRQFINLMLLGERIESGWTPEDEFAEPNAKNRRDGQNQ